MKRQAGIGALLLVCLGIVLGATVFRTDIAQATGLDKAAQNVIVKNTPAEAVPVREQGTVKVTTDAASAFTSQFVSADPNDSATQTISPTIDASIVTIQMDGNVYNGILRYQNGDVFVFDGPANDNIPGPSTFTLPLPQPVPIDEIKVTCASAACSERVNIVGT